MKNELLLSSKYKAFLKHNAKAEFLEGTTAAGKTTVALFKFMLKVAESPKKLHILAADDTGSDWQPLFLQQHNVQPTEIRTGSPVE